MEPFAFAIVVITADHVAITNIVAEAVTLIVLVVTTSAGMRGFRHSRTTTAARAIMVVRSMDILIYATATPCRTHTVTLRSALCASAIVVHISLIVAAGTVIRVVTVAVSARSLSTFVRPRRSVAAGICARALGGRGAGWDFALLVVARCVLRLAFTRASCTHRCIWVVTYPNLTRATPITASIHFHATTRHARAGHRHRQGLLNMQRIGAEVTKSLVLRPLLSNIGAQ